MALLSSSSRAPSPAPAECLDALWGMSIRSVCLSVCLISSVYQKVHHHHHHCTSKLLTPFYNLPRRHTHKQKHTSLIYTAKTDTDAAIETAQSRKKWQRQQKKRPNLPSLSPTNPTNHLKKKKKKKRKKK